MTSMTSSFSWFGDRIINQVRDWRDRKLMEAGQAVVNRARQLAPRHTGYLAASILYEVVGGTLTIDVGAPYGIFQEFGTRTIPPHPYLRPALNEVSRVFGTSIEMAFNAPAYASPIYAHQGGFVVPKSLTSKQRRHVATHLLPTSKRLYRGNVKRAKMRIRRPS